MMDIGVLQSGMGKPLGFNKPQGPPQGHREHDQAAHDVDAAAGNRTSCSE